MVVRGWISEKKERLRLMHTPFCRPPGKAAGKLDSVGIKAFEEFFHHFVHLLDELGEREGLAASRALHIGLVAGTANIQGFAAMGADERSPRLARGKEEGHVLSFLYRD
jgi:hypothetical protein